MSAATPTRAKRLPRKAAPVRVGFARFCEAFSPGEPPTAARILRAGHNATDKGDLNFTPRSAKAVMASYEGRSNPLAWYYNHEDQLPLEKQGGAPMKGVCSAPSSVLVIRDSPTGPECWAEQIAWTDEAKRQIKSGERRQLSPVAAYDKDTREVIEILNVSLVGEGATHNGTILASRSGKDTGGMDDMIQQLLDAINSGDFEAAENIVQQMEATDGGEGMGKMARGLMAKMAKDAAPPPPPKPTAPVAATKLAATRADLVQGGRDAEAFSRAIASMEAATANANAAARRSDRATVSTLIAASREFFDAVDEREHLGEADPAATQKHIASMGRKAKEAAEGRGILAAGRGEVVLGADGKPVAARLPKDPPPPPDPLAALSAGDRIAMDAFNRGKKAEAQITAADFLRSKAAQAPRGGN